MDVGVLLVDPHNTRLYRRLRRGAQVDGTLFHVELINFHPIYSFNHALYMFRCFRSLAPIKELNEFCPSSVI